MRRSFYYLEEFKVGDRFTTLSRTVTETDVVLFAGITGDNNPIHTDRTYAESLPFGSRIAHGLLGAGIATGLWGRMGLVDGSAIAALGTEWQLLVRLKSEIRFIAKLKCWRPNDPNRSRTAAF